jgi:hypothetical protein
MMGSGFASITAPRIGSRPTLRSRNTEEGSGSAVSPGMCGNLLFLLISAAEEHPTAPQAAINDGTRDIGTAPNPTMLLRNLDPLVTEEDICEAIESMGGVADRVASGGGVRRILIIRDRTTRSSWGFAFVQFGSAEVRLPSSSLTSSTLEAYERAITGC